MVNSCQLSDKSAKCRSSGVPWLKHRYNVHDFRILGTTWYSRPKPSWAQSYPCRQNADMRTERKTIVLAALFMMFAVWPLSNSKSQPTQCISTTCFAGYLNKQPESIQVAKPNSSALFMLRCIPAVSTGVSSTSARPTSAKSRQTDWRRWAFLLYASWCATNAAGCRA